jgi:tight adherence protein B
MDALFAAFAQGANVKVIFIALMFAGALAGIVYVAIAPEPKKASQRIAPDGRALRRKKQRKRFLALLDNGNQLEEKRKELKTETKKSGLKEKLAQAGLNMSPTVYIAVFAAAAIILTAIAYFILRAPLYVVLPLPVVIGALGPFWFINKRINRRREKFLKEFANAIDILVRGVSAGLPVNEGLKVIAKDAPDPVGEEFERMVAASNVGFSLDEAATELANRIPSTDVNFFRTVLVIQKQTGGNLAEALGNLSNIIRERQKLHQKVWAMSSEARMSAMIIGALPILIAGLVYLLRPDYIGGMLEQPLGQMLLAGAGGWMLVGVFVMRSMINLKV